MNYMGEIKRELNCIVGIKESNRPLSKNKNDTN